MANSTGFLKLSDITPSMEDAAFHIDTAIPVERPTLFILIGSPGAGKSSGHKYALDAMGIGGGAGAPGYATIDLDLLVEKMESFRAASMLARIISRDPELKAFAGDIAFPTMEAYISDRQNLKMFDWFDELIARVGLTAEQLNSPEWGGDEVMNAIKQLWDIRKRWGALKGIRGGEALWKRTNIAIERAMSKRVNIVYETTMGPGKFGKKIAKFDALKTLADRYGYNIHLYHIGCSDPAKQGALIEEIQTRVTGRQEFNTPFRAKPFWRYVPPEGIKELVEKNAIAFNYIQSYVPESPTVHFAEYCPIPLEDEPRRLAPREFNLERELTALGAYSGAPILGGKRRKTRGRRHRRSTRRNTRRNRFTY
jgi:hypothetical protein